MVSALGNPVGAVPGTGSDAESGGRCASLDPSVVCCHTCTTQRTSAPWRGGKSGKSGPQRIENRTFMRMHIKRSTPVGTCAASRRACLPALHRNAHNIQRRTHFGPPASLNRHHARLKLHVRCVAVSKLLSCVSALTSCLFHVCSSPYVFTILWPGSVV